ncbi:hypothetical protein VW35_16715 [Devosia soli]|uniref:AMP nucleosidase n=1 Tax=Devosia soli TaxID=361041 RepID=A0A0F5L1Z5_9HYPH|nr:hypothetical protein [Devosia soli]KKB76446.1 hypothetical protein VW35_16715 [Devosia soli]
MAELARNNPVIGIFASDKGPGDPERASLMTQAGTLFAKRGAHLVCLWENGAGPLPLMTAAQTAGGSVSILADSSEGLPPTLAQVPVTVVPDAAARHARLAEEVQVLVALPGSLASASALFGAWSARGMTRPVVMLNRHKAFEVIKGFAGDVLSHALPGYDKNIQFSDTVDDLWNKVSWVLEQKR